MCPVWTDAGETEGGTWEGRGREDGKSRGRERTKCGPAQGSLVSAVHLTGRQLLPIDCCLLSHGPWAACSAQAGVLLSTPQNPEKWGIRTEPALGMSW